MIEDIINFSAIILLITSNETCIPIEGINDAIFNTAISSIIIEIFKLPNNLRCFFFLEFSKNNNMFDKEKTMTKKEAAKDISGRIGDS